MTRSGEFDLIARFLAPLASGYRGALNLKDDAAIVDTSDGLDRIVTADTVVEGVHFLSSDPPARIAQKALRVNLSDLAAMGCTPEVFTLALHLPRSVDDDWVAGLARGFRDDQAQYGITLIGGDTVSSDGPAMLSITAIGKIGRGEALQRSGAADGDDIYITGTVGDAGLGLRILQDTAGHEMRGVDRQAAIDRYQLPEPRVGFGPALVGLASACIDVSDGLVADLEHVAAASGLAAQLKLGEVPWSPAVLAARDYPETDRVTAGDDYELLFTAPADRRTAIDQISSAADMPVRRIGRMAVGGGVNVLDKDGAPVPLAIKGYRHR